MRAVGAQVGDDGGESFTVTFAPNRKNLGTGIGDVLGDRRSDFVEVATGDAIPYRCGQRQETRRGRSGEREEDRQQRDRDGRLRSVVRSALFVDGRVQA